jgi:signal transduction histidine kinase
MAHHVNNALTGVIGHLELARRSASPRGPVADHLQASLACAFQAADAVKRIVAFACRPPAPQAVAQSLALVADQLAGNVRSLGRPGLTVMVTRESPGWVLAAETVLQSALEQVVANALEAMPSGGTLRLHVHERDRHSCLSITDNGGGIPPEILARLFEPFRTTKASGHLGLGLVLCRDMMLLLGGRLDVVSKAGQGTTITLALPRLEKADLPAARPHELAEPVVPHALDSFPAASYAI